MTNTPTLVIFFWITYMQYWEKCYRPCWKNITNDNCNISCIESITVIGKSFNVKKRKQVPLLAVPETWFMYRIRYISLINNFIPRFAMKCSRSGPVQYFTTYYASGVLLKFYHMKVHNMEVLKQKSLWWSSSVHISSYFES